MGSTITGYYAAVQIDAKGKVTDTRSSTEKESEIDYTRTFLGWVKGAAGVVFEKGAPVLGGPVALAIVFGGGPVALIAGGLADGVQALTSNSAEEPRELDRKRKQDLEQLKATAGSQGWSADVK
jgi:hypothetical protein